MAMAMAFIYINEVGEPSSMAMPPCSLSCGLLDLLVNSLCEMI